MRYIYIICFGLCLTLTGCVSNISKESSLYEVKESQGDNIDYLFSDNNSTEENKTLFDYILLPFWKENNPPYEKDIVTALINSGAEADKIQVTPQTTLTGLKADNVFISVYYNEKCYIAQFAYDAYLSQIRDAINGSCLVGGTVDISSLI